MISSSVDVEFVSPLPGLGSHTSFALEPIAGAEGLYALRAKDSDLRLFLLDPAVCDYRYKPTLFNGIRAELGASDKAKMRVFVVANPSEDGVYLNLRAPIVLNDDTARAAQVILEDQAYPVRALLAG